MASKKISSKFFTYILFALFLTIQVYQGVIEAARLPSSSNRELDFQQPLQTDPEFELALRQQQLIGSNRLPAFRKQQFNLNNSPDVAALIQASKQLIRLQRSLSSTNQASALPAQQLTNQQLLEDEHAFKRQLPDLIAQAHNDRTLERALLRMLINASLKSALANNGRQETSSSQENAEGGLNSLEAGNALARLQQATLDMNYAGIDPLVNDYSQSLQQDGYQTTVDKREYIKPCSFNAVSCAKNPFRKIQ